MDINAAKWAEGFCRCNPDVNEDVLQSWFADVIAHAQDEVLNTQTRSLQATLDAREAEWKALVAKDEEGAENDRPE